jgi:hypothetical protein
MGSRSLMLRRIFEAMRDTVGAYDGLLGCDSIPHPGLLLDCLSLCWVA